MPTPAILESGGGCRLARAPAGVQTDVCGSRSSVRLDRWGQGARSVVYDIAGHAACYSWGPAFIYVCMLPYVGGGA
jgi:hypothetical protein